MYQRLRDICMDNFDRNTYVVSAGPTVNEVYSVQTDELPFFVEDTFVAPK